MVTKKYWKTPIIEFISLVKQEKEKKLVKILDISFEVFPNVFSPIYSSDTAWFAEKIIPLIQKKKFLEIGSGAGVVVCLAAIHGAINVIATDINPHAINNVLSNAKLHSLPIEARIGSVFDPISNDELFDVIFWNHPFYYLDEKTNDNDVVSLSVYDTEYQSLRKFFLNGKRHLEKGGQLILGTSNVARINLIKKLAKEEGYSVRLLEKTEVPIYKEKKIKMDLRMYSFKPFSQ
jgi:release factor glutamine methyltransferase